MTKKARANGEAPTDQPVKRVRTTRTETHVEPIDQPPPAAPGDGEDEDLGLESPLDGLAEDLSGGQGYINVFRLADGKNSLSTRAFCHRETITEDFDSGEFLERLQRKCGGGEYAGDIYANRGSGVKRRVRFTVADARDAVAPAAAPAQDQVAAQIQAALAPMQTVLAELGKRPAFDWKQILAGASVALPLLQQVKSLLSPGVPGAVPGDLLGQLQQLAKVKETLEALDIGGEPSTVATITRLVEKYGEPLLGALAKAQQQRGRAPARPGQPQLGPVAPASPAVVIPSGPGSDEPAAVPAAVPEFLRPFVPLIAQHAAAGTVPEEFAQLVLDRVPDERLDELCDSIESGELLGALLAIPELSGRATWLNAVAKTILSEIESVDAAPGGGQPGELVPVPDPEPGAIPDLPS